MSQLQNCHCGWSKVTSYQGLRTHQGKMGCTPKGMSIPQNKQLSYFPSFTYVGPPIKVEEPVFDIFRPSVKPNSTEPLLEISCQSLRIHQGETGGNLNGMRIPEIEQYPRRNQWEQSHQDDSRLEANTFLSSNLLAQMDPGVRKTAMEIFKTFVDNQQHPVEMDADLDNTHRALNFPTPAPPVFMSTFQNVTTPMNPAAKDTKVEPNKSLVENQQHSQQMGGNLDNTHRALNFPTPAPPVFMSTLQNVSTPMNPAAKDTKVETNKSLVENQQHSLQMGANLNQTHPTFGFTTSSQSDWIPALPSITTPKNPAAKDTKVEPNKSLVENQQHSLQMGGNLDNTHRALNFPTPAPPDFMLTFQNVTTPMNPAAKDTKMEPNKSLVENQQHSLQMGANLDNTHQALNFPTPAPPDFMSTFQNVTTPMNPAAKDTKVETNKSLAENQQHSQQMGANSDKIHRPFAFTSSSQPVLMPASQTNTTPMNSAATKTPMKETNKSLFETPQSSHQTTTSSSSNKACRALDFSTGAQQAGKLWEVPTSIGQETFNQSKEKEREREAQKLLKARQDMMRADLQQKIHTREHKMADVRSSVTAYKGSLDAEWLEINGVFSEVMKVVEDARQKALQPLEQRRREAKREAQDLIQKLQREIDVLKKTMDELDTKPDLQVSPLTGLKESWKNVSVDTSFSFGTLRTTTSVMIQQIQEKLENLSSIELKRIPAFAVDVKLDPTTAHQCLVLSADGKKVRDGGQTAELPDTPQRFDAFGSILGLDSFTAGRSYWEVEVSNKTGWDLGVARGGANRKGKLKLSPDDGYWVTVHYDDKKYAALTTPPVSLSLKEKAEKVGVFVDYEEGLVSFYDVTAQSHIYSFTQCSFGEPIFPYFSPHLKQNGKNADPLIISAVQKQQ